MKLSEILEKLHQPIPIDFISHKSLKGNRIDYVAWFDLCDILDERVGIANWSWQIKDIQQIGNRLTLTGVLTILGEDKSLTREATGCEDVDCNSFGDPSSNAEAMALRRCCAKYGLGRKLWRKEKKEPQLPNLPRMRKVEQSPTGEITREEWLRRRSHQQKV